MNENEPLVSVVIPSYNHADYIEESIKSIINQEYQNIELIIIDDGSKDNSIEKIQGISYQCYRRFVRFEFRYRTNKGLSATLNEALEWAKGKYFSPLASDDIALPNKIKFLVDMQKKYNAAAVFGSAEVFNEEFTGKCVRLNCEHTQKELLFFKNIPIAPASLIKTGAIREAGGYPEDIALEDIYMWLRLTANKKRIYSFPKVVVKYRSHDNNTIKRFRFMHEERLKVLKYFSYLPDYERAKKNAVLLGLKSIANEETIYPITEVFKRKLVNKGGFVVILKSLTPKLFIKTVKKMMNRV